MAKRSQPPRPYDSSSRQASAAESRRRVVRAAHALFVANGYGATTIAAVARAAGVSTPTLYAGFKTKAQLLKATVDAALAGDDAPITVADRPLSQWVYEADTAHQLVARYAVMMGELAGRAAEIYDVLESAADSDPELTALLDDMEQQRLRASTMVAKAIEERGGLPAERSVDVARDLVWICNAPRTYVDLVIKRRWSTKRYVAWARTALTKLVLEPPVR